MMKLPCAAVRDLLPLYAEKMAEPETLQMVQEHLTDCPECRQKFSEIESGERKPVDSGAALQTLKNEIRRRRWQAALIAGLSVFILVFACMYQQNSFQPLAWREGLVEVSGVEPADSLTGAPALDIQGQDALPEEKWNVLVLLADSSIAGTEMQETTEDDGTTTVFLQGFARLSDDPKPVGNPGRIVLSPVPDRVIYGYSAPQKVLWGDPLRGGGEVLPRLTLAYYVLMACGLSSVTGICWYVFRKRDFSWMLRQAFFAPVSYLLAHVLLKGMRMTSFLIERDFRAILLMTAALYALLSLGWQVWLRRRKEQ